jgi:hypothetical protein
MRRISKDENEIDGRGTWPELEIGMNFYIPVDVIFIQLEDCSDYTTGIESQSLVHDEREFVSSNDTMSRTRTTPPYNNTSVSF